MAPELVGFNDHAQQMLRSYEVVRDPLDAVLVPDALVQPAGSPGGWIQQLTGGVFDADGVFVEPSAQPRADGHVAIRGGQPPLAAPAAAETVEEAVYGGALFDHFGHFLLESTARLWFAEREPRLPWIFIGPPADFVRPWHHAFLELLGLTPDQVIVAHDPVRVRRLHVPASAIRYHDRVSPRYLEPFRRARGGTPRRFGKTYLSRSHLRLGATVGERELEELVAQDGWTVRRSEKMPPEDQVALFRSDDPLMGVQGSGFHLSLFAPPGRRTVQLCRHQMARAYYMLDGLGGIDSVYFAATREVAGMPAFAASGPFLLDLDATVAFLRDRDLIRRAPVAVPKPSPERYEAAWRYCEAMHAHNRGGAADETAFASAVRAAALAPDDPVYVEQMVVQRAKRSRAEGFDLMEEAIRTFPDDPRFPFLLSYFRSLEGDNAAALAPTRRAAALAPDVVRYANRLATVLWRCGAVEEARDVLSGLMERGRADTESYRVLGLIEEGAGDLDAACRWARVVVDRDRFDPDAALRLLKLLTRAGRADEAAEQARRARARFPDHPAIAGWTLEDPTGPAFGTEAERGVELYRRSREALHAGDAAGALASAREAAALLPGNEVVIAHLVNALRAAGEVADAVREGERAAVAFPASANIRHFLALAYEAADRPEDARRSSAEALRIAPDNQWIRDLDARLRVPEPEPEPEERSLSARLRGWIRRP